MWSKISSALKARDGNDSNTEHSDAQSSPSSPPDPFCVNATTYYTPEVPPSPPQSGHSRTASREEDIIWSLRTQLALQQELCVQFEIDLRARDELVEALTIRLTTAEKENDERKNVIRSWKKKATDLEKMCRYLEEEVDLSRQVTIERSVIDVASGAALQQLHAQISELEEQNNGLLRERDAAARAREEADTEALELRSQLQAHIQQLQKDSAVKEVAIVQLNKQRNQDKEDIDGLNIALESKQQELELVKRKHSARGAVGPAPGRTRIAPSTSGKLAGKENSTTTVPLHPRRMMVPA